ncbi:MAG: hypothetical protein K6C33_01860, partial [Desulfovibrio sp.]|nr:hypothetical protein [Desulfovibrio sp.]
EVFAHPFAKRFQGEAGAFGQGLPDPFQVVSLGKDLLCGDSIGGAHAGRLADSGQKLQNFFVITG